MTNNDNVFDLQKKKKAKAEIKKKSCNVSMFVQGRRSSKRH